MLFTLDNSWGTAEDGTPLLPRRWQRECLPVLGQHFAQSMPAPAIISAIMGSGKAKMIGQLLACCQFERGEVAIVSAPTILLVQQLEATIRARLETGAFMSGRPGRVGTYYTDSKDTLQQIIIACTPSLPVLAEKLKQQGRTTALWVVDEAHRHTETANMHAANVTLQPKVLIGFTATPFLADEARRLSLFKKILYRLTAADALRDGIVVDWDIKNWEGGAAGEEGLTLDSACLSLTEKATGPGLFNAFNIADAEAFAEKLRNTKRSVECVHSAMPREEIKRRLKDLENGRHWALVHVRMLTEGFDLPCMRFLCLRRPMTSRVDFAQQLGRGMRAFPGKDKIVVYDPHDLMALFSITPEEALGGAPSIEDDKLTEGERTVKQLSMFADEMMKHVSKVRAGKMPLDIKPLQTYLTTLVNAFDVCGMIERNILGRQWRGQAASGKQTQTVENMAWVPTGRRCVPVLHQRALSLLTGKYENAADRQTYAMAMNRGTASDLITVLKSLANKKVWPDVKNIDQAAAEGLRRQAEAATSRAAPITPLVPSKPAAPVFEQGSLFDNKKTQGF